MVAKLSGPKSKQYEQVSNRVNVGPALMRRDKFAAALKGDREPLFKPYVVMRAPDRRPPPDPLPPAFQVPKETPRTRLVSLASAPFPFRGVNPRTGKKFLNYRQDGRVGHKTGFGRLYWEDQTYSDDRVLLHVPRDFDVARPGVMVVFFHGHGATLSRDVLARQQLPAQITASGMNAVLVAPQMALDARDSSAGKLWTRGGTRKLLDEAADRLAEMLGNEAARETFRSMPIILVGYSGGYVPTAWSLSRGGLGDRVKGVVLLDGLYGEISKFASWISRNRTGFFLSAYAGSTKWRNVSLQRQLAKRSKAYGTELPKTFGPGSVTFLEVMERHRHYVTRAWTNYPIADLLSRLPGTIPIAQIAQPAAIASATKR